MDVVHGLSGDCGDLSGLLNIKRDSPPVGDCLFCTNLAHRSSQKMIRRVKLLEMTAESPASGSILLHALLGCVSF